jgi:alpha-tubulin suppressor-like RCC1 family protein
LGLPGYELAEGFALGDNEAPTYEDPLDLGEPAVSIALGEVHGCALLGEGTLRCWGGGNSTMEMNLGQLGYGDTVCIGDDEVPATVGPVDVGGPVASVACGTYHTCAILESGALRCWGGNQGGQLGYGHTSNLGDEPGEMPVPDVPVL